MSDEMTRLGSELRGRVAEGAERHRVPGAAVGVLRGGEQDIACHGVTSIPNPLPVDEGTFFQIGSTGKTFTATAIMVLVERGLLDLDAPVRRYIPELRLRNEHAAANVTVLQLLNHTAGWAGDFFADTGDGDDALARFAGRLADAAQEHPLGERIAYNNAAVSLAGHVVECVTGTTYEAAVQQLVLDPLGFGETLYFPWDVMLRRFAVGHMRRDEQVTVAPWHGPRSGAPAGGSIASTVRDQLRWARFHLGLGDGPGLLRRDTLERMQSPTTPAAARGAIEAVGISWLLREIDGVRIVAHGGTTLGHQSAFELVPERDFAITVLTNAGYGGGFNTEIVNWALEAYLGIVDRDPQPLPLSPAELAEYAGIYESHVGTVDVRVVDDYLLGVVTINAAALAEILPPGVEFPPQPPIPFKILPNDGFITIDGPDKGMRGTLSRGPDGRIAAIDLGGRILVRRA